MLLSVSEAKGIECEYFPRIASALGAGLCHQGEVCGIALGALLAIGLQYGRRQGGDSNEINYYLGSEFLDKFRQIKGTIKCRDLTNADFNTTEGEKAWIEWIQDETCSPLMEKAIIILNDLLSPGDRVDTHSHPNEHERIIEAGEIIDVFTPPRKDYL